eukprot:EG_transcript_29165
MPGVLQCGFWLLLLGLQGAQIAAQLFYVAMFIDYEDDTGLSSGELSQRLRKLFTLEYIGHAVNCVLLLFGFRILLFLFNIPIVIFHVHQFTTGQYLIDAEMLWKRVSTLKEFAIVKLVVHVIFMMAYVVLTVMTFVETWPRKTLDAPGAAALPTAA